MSAKSTTQSKSKEIFLDGLVQHTLDLAFIRDNSANFLELALDHQDDYFLDVLNRNLKIAKIKGSKLYVVADGNCFEYQKRLDRGSGDFHVYRLSNTRYTILEPIDYEEERITDDGKAKEKGPTVLEPEIQKFTGIGNIKQLLDYWRIGWGKDREKQGSAKPFRVLFFDKKTKSYFDRIAQSYSFFAVPRVAPYHGFEKLLIYLYYAR